MKKYSKLIVAAIVVLIFIGTFVFLWQKSQPEEVVYNEFTPKVEDLRKTTIVTGKIEPRNEVNASDERGGRLCAGGRNHCQGKGDSRYGAT